MENNVNFDALCQKTMAPEMTRDDLNNLYGNAFALPEWYFIARGEFPNVGPYIASNAATADGKTMIRAFTDRDRLERFVKENHLEEADGGHLALSIPTGSIRAFLLCKCGKRAWD